MPDQNNTWVARREALMAQWPEALILVRGASNPNFFYLCGFEEPNAALLLSPAGVRVGTGREKIGPDYFSGRQARSALFLPRADAHRARWGDAAETTLESADAAAQGVEKLYAIDSLEAWLDGWLRDASQLVLVDAAPPSLTAPIDPLVERIKARFHSLSIVEGASQLGAQRQVKDVAEVATIRQAAAITADGFAALREQLAAGVRESALEAALTASYRSAGAVHGFEPIVASGRNALRLHYRDNSDQLEAGQLLLVDSGARFEGYGADVSRTYPIDGTFSPRQRELYSIVLEAQLAAAEAIRPGVTLGELHRVAWESIDQHGLGDAFVHGIGHHLGIETHDAGDVQAPLQVGAVITIEPGVYLEDEGIGIRIEDDYLVTEQGSECLTAAIPKSLEELEG